jgi:hypothetical protein
MCWSDGVEVTWSYSGLLPSLPPRTLPVIERPLSYGGTRCIETPSTAVISEARRGGSTETEMGSAVRWTVEDVGNGINS